MNKYLMMSAAAVMGTVATGVAQPATAGTFVGSVGFYYSFSGSTGPYCDSYNIYASPGGQYAAQHAHADCGSSTFLPANGVKDKKTYVFGDIVLAADDYSLNFDMVYPYKIKKGRKTSHWDLYGSTNGTTAFLLNSGVEGTPYVFAKNGKNNKTSTVSKVQALLKKS